MIRQTAEDVYAAPRLAANMAGAAGIELATSGFGDQRSAN